MTAIACPLCGHSTTTLCFTSGTHELRACAACRFHFISPYPEMKSSEEKVREFEFEEEVEVRNPAKHYRTELMFYERWYPRIRASCGVPDSVLDVGCGTGRLLQLFAADGVQRRTGIELNAARAGLARQHAGCEILEVPVEEFAPDAPYALVTMINVFSHIPHVPLWLEGVRRLLQENGHLLMLTGEIQPGVQRGDMFDWQIPSHVQWLGKGTLAALCEQHGFMLEKEFRATLSKEYFNKTAFSQVGRSGLRNSIKGVLRTIPGALPTLAAAYSLKTGDRVQTCLTLLRKV